MNIEELCFKPAGVMLPMGCDMSRWSVIACDQYTSEPEYWADVEKIVGDAPSSYNLIFPEAYLGSGDEKKRIEKINGSMKEYVSSGYFRTLPATFILVERELSDGKVRLGLMGMVDLEQYDYNPGASTYIRATEGTVLDRLPPRVKVRKGATIELPHIMLLIDDPEKTVIEPLAEIKDRLYKEYDFELMKNGGHIKGYSLPKELNDKVAQAICDLADIDLFKKRYNVDSEDVLLFASGDGNHSLATAKQCWELAKKNMTAEEIETSPKRYALVELVNLHDTSLEFEAIHRVVFGVDGEKMLDALMQYYPSAHEGHGKGHSFEFVIGDRRGLITIEGMTDGLPVGALQDFLDVYTKEHGGKIDYIHGEDVTCQLGSMEGNIGFIVPSMGKNELFRAVITRGVLPRKTFSMGHANDKRYYLEARSLI